MIMSPQKFIANSLVILFTTVGTVAAAESDRSTISRDECEKTQSADARAPSAATTEKAGRETDTGSSATSESGAKSATDHPNKSPDEVVKEIVADAKPSEGGQMVASTGRARPVESWFGCPPK
jgi:hypothetical protein